jgi:hypothetical protein
MHGWRLVQLRPVYCDCAGVLVLSVCMAYRVEYQGMIQIMSS